MNIYQQISVTMALLLYIPLAYQLLTGKVTQNLASYLLWGSLDTIAGASMLFSGSNNYQLPFAYVGGCMVIILCILKAKTFTWTKFETRVSIMVLLCIIGWMVSGPKLATILSSTGMVVAGVPLLRDSWRRPETSPFAVYVGYSLVNGLSTMGGRAWTIEERLFPGACFIYCVAVVLASSRKFRR